jgi:crotonobetainyl-CoA:carnitine CoA-transferase CaiB-like acyl-CoA transferase
MTQALDGIRVLDLTRGPAGGIATMILADFGAEVLLIEQPHVTHVLDELAAAPMWRRGKQILPLDLDDEPDLAVFHELAAGADVLVCNWRTPALERKCLDYQHLHKRHPHLVFCHITGFGSRGPMADLPGYEHTVAAHSGRMRMFTGIVDRPGPVFSAVQVGVHACAQSAVTGILAALFQREFQGGFQRGSQRTKSGAGRLVETSLLQGMLPYEVGGTLGRQFPDQFAHMKALIEAPSATPPMPNLNYHPVQAGDGRWMQFGNLLPHLFDNLMTVANLTEFVADPDFDPELMSFRSQDKHEAFRARMLKRIQDRSAPDWMADFVADGGIVATPHQSTQEALDDPDIVANGHVVERDDGGVQIGPLARLTKTPARIGEPAQANQGRAEDWRASPRPAPSIDAADDLPLAGLRVVEFATIIATPLGAAFLADMGAEVIKVEQIGGDPFRGMLGGLGAVRVNGGKHSISVNMKSPEGIQIVRELLADADVVMHNFRPGVPERLGIDYEQVAAINPAVVYLQANGYGPDGPGAPRPSTHPIPGAALGGVAYQMGGRLPEQLQDIEGLKLWTSRMMRANELNPDPNTSVVVATSIMLGLMARQHTGLGQQILLDMFGANAYANSDDFLRYPGKAARPMPDEELHGLSASYRLYPCAKGQWIFLAIVTPRERQCFRDALQGAGIVPPSEALLRAGDDALAQSLQEMFVSHDADYWASLLSDAGVGCVRADGPAPCEFWLVDTQVDALGLTAEVDHAEWGRYRRLGPMVLFDGQCQTLGPAPLGGQHNVELLTSLGYNGEQVASLLAEGIIWQEG